MIMVHWLDDAAQDLRELRRYIALENPLAAKNMVRRLLSAANLLKEQPEIGRPGRIINIRELIVTGTPYFLPYRFNFNLQRIEILRVMHCARQWSVEQLTSEIEFVL